MIWYKNRMWTNILDFGSDSGLRLEPHRGRTLNLDPLK